MVRLTCAGVTTEIHPPHTLIAWNGEFPVVVLDGAGGDVIATIDDRGLQWVDLASGLEHVRGTVSYDRIEVT